MCPRVDPLQQYERDLEKPRRCGVQDDSTHRQDMVMIVTLKEKAMSHYIASVSKFRMVTWSLVMAKTARMNGSIMTASA
jgi:hypothetical protein